MKPHAMAKASCIKRHVLLLRSIGTLSAAGLAERLAVQMGEAEARLLQLEGERTGRLQLGHELDHPEDDHEGGGGDGASPGPDGLRRAAALLGGRRPLTDGGSAGRHSMSNLNRLLLGGQRQPDSPGDNRNRGAAGGAGAGGSGRLLHSLLHAGHGGGLLLSPSAAAAGGKGGAFGLKPMVGRRATTVSGGADSGLRPDAERLLLRALTRAGGGGSGSGRHDSGGSGRRRSGGGNGSGRHAVSLHAIDQQEYDEAASSYQLSQVLGPIPAAGPEGPGQPAAAAAAGAVLTAPPPGRARWATTSNLPDELVLLGDPGGL